MRLSREVEVEVVGRSNLMTMERVCFCQICALLRTVPFHCE